MIAENKWKERLIAHEGLRLKPYRDNRGFLTIGVGRCLDKNPFSADELQLVGNWRQGISQAAAMQLLQNDVERLLKNLASRLDFWPRLDDERQYALLDMAFQMGMGGLLKFCKMLAAIREQNWDEASRQCLDSDYGRRYRKRAHEIAALLKCGAQK